MHFLTEGFLDYAARQDNKQLLQDRLLNPLIKYLAVKLWPYVLGVTVYLTLVSLLLVVICYLVIKASKQ